MKTLPCPAWIVAATVSLALAVPSRAQTCIGDCDGDGEVQVHEAVLGVTMLLRDLPLDVCAQLDADANARVDMNELVLAVGDATYGCGVRPTPTPSPTATPTSTATNTRTATPTFTATPSASPTPTATPSPGVAGVWIEDDLRIPSSTCVRQIDDVLQSELERVLPCENRLSVEGSRITLVDCVDDMVEGELDPFGVARFRGHQSQSQSGCTVTIDIELTVDLSRSPTTAGYDLEIDLSGRCAFSDCRMRFETTWVRS